MNEDLETKKEFNPMPLISSAVVLLCSTLASFIFSTTWLLIGIVPLMIAASEFSKLIITKQTVFSLIVSPLSIALMALIQVFVKSGMYPVVMAGSFIVAGAVLAIAAEHNLGRLATNIIIASIYGVFFIGAAFLAYVNAGLEVSIDGFKDFFNTTMNQVQTNLKDSLYNLFSNNPYTASISNLDEYVTEMTTSLVFTFKAVFVVVFIAILEFMGHFTAGFYVFTAKRTGLEIIVPLGGWLIEMSHISAIVFFISEAAYFVFYLLGFFGAAVDIPYIIAINFIIVLMPNLIFLGLQRMFIRRPGQNKRRIPIWIFIILLFIAPFLLLIFLASIGALSIYNDYRKKKLEEMKNDEDHFDDFNDNNDNNDNNDYQ